MRLVLGLGSVWCAVLSCTVMLAGVSDTAFAQAADTDPAPAAVELEGALSEGFDAFERPESAEPVVDPAVEQDVAGDDAVPANSDGDASVETPATGNAPHSVKLGELGYDPEGRPGRVHIVVRGDTLWDVSDAYLGTPWVWPSVWHDNRDIENPHLINPGDHIWITPNEMRRISPEEAEAYLAGAPPEPIQEQVPAAFDETVDQPEVPLPVTYRYSELHSSGFVTEDEFGGAATIVDAQTNKVWLSEPDTVLIGWGRGETQVGKQYEIFRPGQKVLHPKTEKAYGFETEMLGWLEVTEVHDETASARIRLSRHEIRRGDHLLPRKMPNSDIELQPTPNIEGAIVHMPNGRTEGGSTDIVYLNRGTEDGLVTGSPLEVYRPMEDSLDEVRRIKLELPDDVVAKLLVVSTRAETAVAVVTHTKTDLERGDRFRGSNSLR